MIAPVAVGNGYESEANYHDGIKRAPHPIPANISPPVASPGFKLRGFDGRIVDARAAHARWTQRMEKTQ